MCIPYNHSNMFDKNIKKQEADIQQVENANGPLKVDSNEKWGGSPPGQKAGIGWVLVWDCGYLPFEHAAFVYKNLFPFPLVSA